MKIHFLIRRISALFLGLIFSLLFLEGALRVFGVYYVHLLTPRDKQLSPSVPTILAYGDSFTFGIGAIKPQYQSFPVHLDKLINKNTDQKRFNVIGIGFPGKNTSFILDWLPETIKSVSPRLVILLAGKVNAWNISGYPDRSNLPLFLSFLQRSKVYLFGKYFHYLLKPRLFFDDRFLYNLDISRRFDSLHINSLLLAGKYEEMGKFCTSKNQTDPEEGMYKICLSTYHLFYHKWEDEAYKWLTSALAGKELNSFTCIMASNVASHLSFPVSLQICNGPLSKSFQEDFFYYGLNGNANQNSVNDKQDVPPPLLRERKYVQNWITDDLNKMIDIIEKSGAKVLLHTYPINRLRQPFNGFQQNVTASWVNKVVLNIASERNLPLVDQDLIFSKFEDRDKFFSPDNHCNTLGYELMAENLAKEILANSALTNH